MAILYPVAGTAEQALYAPSGYAARAREAQALAADGEVVFVTELVGPAFASPEAALDAYRTRAPLDAPPETRWGDVVPVSPPSSKAAAPNVPLRPVYRDGRRWPEPPADVALLWRLTVSYWRIGGPAEMGELGPARRLRRGGGGEALNGVELNALARQPLRAVKPQQPLDIGLFEARRPEAPDLIVPDE